MYKVYEFIWEYFSYKITEIDMLFKILLYFKHTVYFILKKIIRDNSVLLKKMLFCYKMTKITLNKVMCFTHDLFPSNLTTKLDRIVKVVLALKFDGQSDTRSKV